MSLFGVIRDALTGITASVESEGNLAVIAKNQHWPIIDLFMHKHQLTITIDGTTSIGDKIVTLVAGHGVINGNWVGFEQAGNFYEGVVINVSVNDIELDSPLDYAFDSNAVAYIHSRDMNIDGSTTTQIFHIHPPTGQKWDITGLTFTLEDNVIMDSSKFGGITALTEGVVLRVENSTIKNIFNVKTNGGFSARSCFSEYDAKAPAGVYGFRICTVFAGQENRGVTIRLNGDVDDELQLLIQDDLSALSRFTCIAHGHIVIE